MGGTGGRRMQSKVLYVCNADLSLEVPSCTVIHTRCNPHTHNVVIHTHTYALTLQVTTANKVLHRPIRTYKIINDRAITCGERDENREGGNCAYLGHYQICLHRNRISWCAK